MEPLVVLVVEDAPEMVAMISQALADDRFAVEAAVDGESAVEMARELVPAVILLDLSLPKLDGVEVCRRVREFSDAYVIMLTGRDSEADRVAGLAVGADDYMVKPIYPRELVARIEAMMRRPRQEPTAPSEGARALGDLEIDTEAREVRVGGEQVKLSRKEYELLDVLSETPGRAVSRDLLLERVWGPSWFGDDHVIDVHLSNLRRKLGDDPREPRYIENVHGYGYRMNAGSR